MPSKGDIFDQLSPDPKGDIFDQLSPDSIDMSKVAGATPGTGRPGISLPSVQMQSGYGSSLSAMASVVGQHLKNMIAGPIGAFTHPATAQEASDLPSPMNNMMGRGIYRMLAEPTINGIRAGNAATNFNDRMNSYEDAIPVVGPWARNIENDVQQHGAVAGLTGLATDLLAPSAAGAALGVVAKPLARQAAVANVTNMIRPSGVDVAFGKQPAIGLLEQPGGVSSKSLPSLLDRTRNNAASVGRQISDTINAAPQVPTDISSSITNPLDIAMQSAAKSNQTALYNRLLEIKQGLTQDMFHDPQTNTIQTAIGPKNLSAVTPSNLFDLKRTVGDNTKWTNQAFDNEVNATQGQIYSGLKDQLNQAVPELQPLNEQYGNLRSAISALQRRIPVEERNNTLGLTDTGLMAGGLLTGEPVTGVAAMLAKKALGSQPIRSAASQALYNYSKRPITQISPNVYRLAAQQQTTPQP